MSSAGSQFPFVFGGIGTGKFITRKRTVNDMAERGKKLTDELKEQIKAHLVLGDNKNDIAKKFNVSWSTVDKLEKEIKQDPDENEKFEKLRDDKKTMMIEKIWASLEDAADLGHQMIKDAKIGKRDIPLNQISTYYGTLYDKMALMKGENTSNTAVTVKLEGEASEWAK